MKIAILSGVSLLVTLAACGGKVDDGTSSTAGGGDTSSASGDGGAGGSAAVSGTTATTTVTTTTGGGTGCGGKGGQPCSAKEYCDFTPNLCGATDAQGVCTPRPEVCNDLYKPVCGCDGLVHSNECDANGAGADANELGGCTPPTKELFGCGAGYCDKQSQYCAIAISDTNEPNTYECKPVPAGCGALPSCACLAKEPCAADFCKGTVDTGLTVSCPGG